jgi:hypothetical protein
MRIRPGRERSLITGILALVITIAGLIIMSGAPGGFGPFLIIWIMFGIVAAAVSFYNAFSRRGLSLYDIEKEDREYDDEARYCPNCGKPAGEKASFCKFCGERLD